MAFYSRVKSKEQTILDFLSFFKRGAAERGQSDFLIVGLGNPGRDYKNNRHNAGFLIVDRLASDLDTALRRMESNSLVANAQYQDNQLLLAKPQTYMNRSGQAVGALMKSHKIPLEQILVIYDDIDLSLGALRLRPDGGAAGHRGMTSIIERLGSSKFPRMRFGIGRPPGRKDAADYVLEDFSSKEFEYMQVALDKAVEAALLFITQGIVPAMNTYNSSVPEV